MLRRDFRRPGFERCQRRRRPPRGSDLPHTAEPRRVAGRSVELQRRHDRPTLDTNRAAATTVTCLKLVDVAGEHDRLQPTALVGLRLNIDAPPLLPLPALSRPGTPRSPLRTRACVLPFRTANRPGVCPLRFAERVLLQVPQAGDVGSMWPPGWSEPAGWTVRISPSWRLASAQQGRGPKLCVFAFGHRRTWMAESSGSWATRESSLTRPACSRTLSPACGSSPSPRGLGKAQRLVPADNSRLVQLEVGITNRC